jgi:hypothetical protein
MPALMPATTTPTFADMHSKPSTDRPRLGQLVLILVLGPLVLDLPATPAPRGQGRVEFLINLPRRLTVPMRAVLIPGPAPRSTRLRLRFPAGERRRLTLPRPPRVLQLPLELPDPPAQPPILARQPGDLAPQPLVLSRQRRAPRREPTKLIHRLGREHLNT